MSEINQDIDPTETQEWLAALKNVLKHEGLERAQFLIQQLMQQVPDTNLFSSAITTPYINTIPVSKEEKLPGDYPTERRLNALIRWNASAMVQRAVHKAPELGGHLATYASAAVLYDVGFNYFFRAANQDQNGDFIYIQGHSSPGIYARAFLEGRIDEKQLDCFRQEIENKGLSSYPHPWLMPNFWQFATVSMGLGPVCAIYQARFLKYLENRQLIKKQNQKVWAFCGDGEMDEPESGGSIHLAAREKLDNLIFVINCNLQRLDGPVNGNGKIIQELEGRFKGAGWNVIKVVWGRYWDPLLEKDQNGILKKRMLEAVDGDYQNYKARDGAYVREHFFGKYPELKAMVDHMSDEEIWHLNRGGLDFYKVYAAYAAAVKHTGQPTVILAKTVKGYGLGTVGEGRNYTHQQKKMALEDLKLFRDTCRVPIKDEDLKECPYYRPDANSPEIQYLKARRQELGGFLPARRTEYKNLNIPELSAFKVLLEQTERDISTTMAFVRMLGILVKDKNIGKFIVPIVPDESRTFGMEGMFRQLGIYSPVGQLYTPVDAEQVMYYREEKDGQILQEGINEGGATASWIAAATSYANNNLPMIPFYIFYSMFGFQRVADLIWAAGDMQARGFLLGATAGRTTLAGEGLQHQDGHSHVFAATVPNCRAYDPTFSYELAIIIQDGLKRMYHDYEKIFYYITVMNENYIHPPMPEGVEEGVIKGLYLFKPASKNNKLSVQLLGCGTIFREVIAAAEILEQEFNVSANIWSATSFNELRREGLQVERYNRFHPKAKAKIPYVTQCLQPFSGPVIAATDYIKTYADQIRAFVPHHYVVLGTDGFGRSDTREQLRHFFEVDKRYIVCAALKALVDQGALPVEKLIDAMQRYKINSDKPDPLTV